MATIVAWILLLIIYIDARRNFSEFFRLRPLGKERRTKTAIENLKLADPLDKSILLLLVDHDLDRQAIVKKLGSGEGDYELGNAILRLRNVDLVVASETERKEDQTYQLNTRKLFA